MEIVFKHWQDISILCILFAFLTIINGFLYASFDGSLAALTIERGQNVWKTGEKFYTILYV